MTELSGRLLCLSALVLYSKMAGISPKWVKVLQLFNSTIISKCSSSAAVQLHLTICQVRVFREVYDMIKNQQRSASRRTMWATAWAFPLQDPNDKGRDVLNTISTHRHAKGWWNGTMELSRCNPSCLSRLGPPRYRYRELKSGPPAAF